MTSTPAVAAVSATVRPARPAAAAERVYGISHSIEPLSPERYKLQLTAGAELKQKLELARDLMRHAEPRGDLATIVERALDLLIEHVMKRRFARTMQPNPRQASTTTEGSSAPADAGAFTAMNGATLAAKPEQAPITRAPTPAPAAETRYLSSETRRAVLARDGMRCAWRGPDGRRCESRAWLEHDHVAPLGCGGGRARVAGLVLAQPLAAVARAREALA